jgi:hypothetical protein
MGPPQKAVAHAGPGADCVAGDVSMHDAPPPPPPPAAPPLALLSSGAGTSSGDSGWAACGSGSVSITATGTGSGTETQGPPPGLCGTVAAAVAGAAAAGAATGGGNGASCQPPLSFLALDSSSSQGGAPRSGTLSVAAAGLAGAPWPPAPGAPAGSWGGANGSGSFAGSVFQEALARFQTEDAVREIAILKKLAHINIVNLVGMRARARRLGGAGRGRGQAAGRGAARSARPQRFFAYRRFVEGSARLGGSARRWRWRRRPAAFSSEPPAPRPTPAPAPPPRPRSRSSTTPPATGCCL